MLSSIKTSLLTALLFALCFAAETRAQQWSEGPPMTVARSDAAVAVLDGEVYVIGGRTTTGQPLDVVEKFNPETSQWSAVESLDDERYAASAVLFEDQILLMGGSEDDGATDDVEVYDPSEDDWESFDDLEDDRTGLGSVVLDGRVYAIGGASESGTFLTSAETYDPDEDEWDVYPDWTLDPGRASFGAATMGDVAYLAGGFSQFGPIDRVERYDVENGTADLAPLSSSRGRLALVHTGGALGGDLFAIGGEDADGVLDTVERFDIEQNDWTPVASLATPRAGAVAAYIDGAIYVVGGEDAFGNALRTMEVFGIMTSTEDPSTPTTFALDAVYPNPFADQTTLSFSLAEPGPVMLAVYDVQGRRVAALADRVMAAGPHRVTWDGRSADGRVLPAGVYLIRVVSDAGTAVAKLTLLR